MRPDAPDEELVRAALDGDRAAMDVLLRRHASRISAVCLRITGNQADAADATQEALIAIVRNLAKFDGRSSFGTWAYRIATNASLDELRRRRRRPIVALDEEHPHDAANVARAPDAPVTARIVVGAALERLPEDFRTAVVLRDVADLDYQEIAEVLDVAVGTVKSRIARGRALLARELGNPDDPGERPMNEPLP